MTTEFPIEMTVGQCARILGFDPRKARRWLVAKGVKVHVLRFRGRVRYTVRTADVVRAFPDAADRVRERMIERFDDFSDV